MAASFDQKPPIANAPWGEVAELAFFDALVHLPKFAFTAAEWFLIAAAFNAAGRAFHNWALRGASYVLILLYVLWLQRSTLRLLRRYFIARYGVPGTPSPLWMVVFLLVLAWYFSVVLVAVLAASLMLETSALELQGRG